MAAEWYYAHDGDRRGPVSEAEIKSLAADGRLRPDDLVWQAGMEAWAEAARVPGLLPPPAAGPPPLPDGGGRSAGDAGLGGMSRSDVQNKKLIAGICGIVAGSLGVHKFVLGMTTPGVIMLVITLASAVGSFLCFPLLASLAVWVIGLVEGILYLTKSDEDFYQTYIVGKKEWF